MRESRRPSLTRFAAFLLIAGFTSMTPDVFAQTPSIASRTAGMERMDGFFPLYWDRAEGRLWMEISRFDTEILYVQGLSAGLGSNEIGLDRGQLGASRIVVFERIGPKVLMVEPNYRFRATTDDPDERRAVEEGFARSVLFGFEVAAETGGRVLVDVTDFMIRDAHGVAGRLQTSGGSPYRVDVSRSAVYLPGTTAFPENTEMDATLTFTSDQGSNLVGAVAPSAEAVTLRQHHSLVQLPDAGYTPRAFDPRAGGFSVSYMDYAAPLGEPVTKRLAARHRLRKADPAAEVSEAVEPIVYYLDRGVPEPIRSALLEGAGWWSEAFEAAGYSNAFRVELLPEGVDKMDVRYNVINWVHRSTRGWSYGESVTDPRTGEILSGRVTLGSLRLRQDYLVGEGLLAPYLEGTEDPAEIEELALARIRQLAAHEVGHTLGFAHNYYASPLGRVSVMEYPHPLVTLAEDGSIDVSDAYASGIGEWDRAAVAWAYQDFPEETDEAEALETILAGAREQGLLFMTNQDLEASPLVRQWANGRDAASELERMMLVRRAALNRFGENAIRTGAPLATMEEALVPLYLHHRYQIVAAASALGGINYSYAMRGDGTTPFERVPRGEQRHTLTVLLRTLQPAELALPDTVLNSLPPRPAGYGGDRELFPRYTGHVFDVVTPAVTLARITVDSLLDPERAARLVEQDAIDPEFLGLEEVIGELVRVVFNSPALNDYEMELQRAAERVVVDGLIQLADTAAMPQVRAIATFALSELRGQLGRGARGTDRAHSALLAADIERFLARPAEPFRQPPAPAVPPGAPLGDPALDWAEDWMFRCWEGPG